MTNTAHIETERGTVTVETKYDTHGRPVLIVHSSDGIDGWTIRKDRSGYLFYEIVQEAGGSLARCLSGRFTSPETALEILIDYLRTRVVGGQTRAKLRYKKRKEDGSATNADGN